MIFVDVLYFYQAVMLYSVLIVGSTIVLCDFVSPFTCSVIPANFNKQQLKFSPIRTWLYTLAEFHQIKYPNAEYNRH